VEIVTVICFFQVKRNLAAANPSKFKASLKYAVLFFPSYLGYGTSNYMPDGVRNKRFIW